MTVIERGIGGEITTVGEMGIAPYAILFNSHDPTRKLHYLGTGSNTRRPPLFSQNGVKVSDLEQMWPFLANSRQKTLLRVPMPHMLMYMTLKADRNKEINKIDTEKVISIELLGNIGCMASVYSIMLKDGSIDFLIVRSSLIQDSESRAHLQSSEGSMLFQKSLMPSMKTAVAVQKKEDEYHDPTTMMQVPFTSSKLSSTRAPLVFTDVDEMFGDGYCKQGTDGCYYDDDEEDDQASSGFVRMGACTEASSSEEDVCSPTAFAAACAISTASPARLPAFPSFSGNHHAAASAPAKMLPQTSYPSSKRHVSTRQVMNCS
jgi:hypothetical protein